MNSQEINTGGGREKRSEELGRGEISDGRGEMVRLEFAI